MTECLLKQGTDLSQFAVKLKEPMVKVLHCFSEIPLEDHLYIIVQIPPIFGELVTHPH
jgi:hypothetical protein